MRGRERGRGQSEAEDWGNVRAEGGWGEDTGKMDTREHQSVTATGVTQRQDELQGG